MCRHAATKCYSIFTEGVSNTGGGGGGGNDGEEGGSDGNAKAVGWGMSRLNERWMNWLPGLSRNCYEYEGTIMRGMAVPKRRII